MSIQTLRLHARPSESESLFQHDLQITHVRSSLSLHTQPLNSAKTAQRELRTGAAVSLSPSAPSLPSSRRGTCLPSLQAAAPFVWCPHARPCPQSPKCGRSQRFSCLLHRQTVITSQGLNQSPLPQVKLLLSLKPFFPF